MQLPTFSESGIFGDYYDVTFRDRRISPMITTRTRPVAVGPLTDGGGTVEGRITLVLPAVPVRQYRGRGRGGNEGILGPLVALYFSNFIVGDHLGTSMFSPNNSFT